MTLNLYLMRLQSWSLGNVEYLWLGVVVSGRVLCGSKITVQSFFRIIISDLKPYNTVELIGFKYCNSTWIILFIKYIQLPNKWVLIHKQDLALNSPQELTCYKTSTKPDSSCHNSALRRERKRGGYERGRFMYICQ